MCHAMCAARCMPRQWKQTRPTKDPLRNHKLPSLIQILLTTGAPKASPTRLKTSTVHSRTQIGRFGDLQEPAMQTSRSEPSSGWTILDNVGKPHTNILPGYQYVPEGGVHLLSPQQWAQVAWDTYPKPRGTRCITYNDSIVLEWHQRSSKKTVPINSKSSNVGTIKLAPGFERYNAYEAMLP
jgi:hypothetical protein